MELVTDQPATVGQRITCLLILAGAGVLLLRRHAYWAIGWLMVCAAAVVLAAQDNLSGWTQGAGAVLLTGIGLALVPRGRWLFLGGFIAAIVVARAAVHDGWGGATIPIMIPVAIVVVARVLRELEGARHVSGIVAE